MDNNSLVIYYRLTLTYILLLSATISDTDNMLSVNISVI